MTETKTTKKRKPARRTKSSKTRAITRVLTHPETGEEIILQEYDEYPDIFKYVAKVMFISGEAGVTQIASKLNIPPNTIRSWQTREGWMNLKREVNRLAAQEAVRASRKAMSNYICEVDRGANLLLEKLNKRLEDVEDKDKLTKEGDLVKFILDLWRIKLTIIRILTYGTESRGFTPHPADLQFDGTQPKKSAKLLSMNSAEAILEGIPSHLRKAADFVLGVEDGKIDSAVLEGLAQHIDQSLKREEEDEDEDKMLY